MRENSTGVLGGKTGDVDFPKVISEHSNTEKKRLVQGLISNSLNMCYTEQASIGLPFFRKDGEGGPVARLCPPCIAATGRHLNRD